MILQEARNLEFRFNPVSLCCEIWIVLILYNNNNNSNNNSNNTKNINHKDNDSYNDNDNDIDCQHHHHGHYNYGRIPITRTFKGNRKRFELSGARRKWPGVRKKPVFTAQ